MQENKKAIRYYVGVGREGLYESGAFFVGAKKEWPSWTPTQDMIKRSPKSYKQFENGMPGGPNNPLGARAIYLFYPRLRPSGERTCRRPLQSHPKRCQSLPAPQRALPEKADLESERKLSHIDWCLKLMFVHFDFIL